MLMKYSVDLEQLAYLNLHCFQCMVKSYVHGVLNRSNTVFINLQYEP